MSRTLLENAPKNRPILKIKDHHLFLPLSLSPRVDDAIVRTYAGSQREKKKERPGERKNMPRSSRGAINRRKQSLIFWNFNSQSVKTALVAARDEQNVVRVYCEKRDSNGKRIRDKSPIPSRAPILCVREYILPTYVTTYIYLGTYT